MNKFALLFMVVVLFSGCYGYKGMHRDFESLEKGDRVKLILNHKSKKGKVIGFENDTLILKGQNGKLEQYSSSEVLKIKKGEFSWFKSVVMPTATFGLLTYVAFVPFDFNFDWSEGEGQ